MVDVQKSDRKGIRVFRGEEAIELSQSKAMSYETLSPEILKALEETKGTEHREGAESLVLFQSPGMSLVRVWFKSNYPLVLHSHDGDCLYFIIAGSVRIGGEEIGAGDGFLVPANVRYTYRPGSEGVELLEFRASETFGFDIKTSNPAYWSKLRDRMISAHEAWPGQPRPSEIMPRSD